MKRILSQSFPYPRWLRDFAGDERGATSIEYGLIAAGISIVIVGALRATGTQLAGAFQAVVNGFTTLG
jgi:pilus assembly protein Flp/PilA